VVNDASKFSLQDGRVMTSCSSGVKVAPTNNSNARGGYFAAPPPNTTIEEATAFEPGLHFGSYA
jgi:hypothetical protein